MGKYRHPLRQPPGLSKSSPSASLLLLMQRLTTLNRLTGKLPQQSDAEGSLRFQSGK